MNSIKISKKVLTITAFLLSFAATESVLAASAENSTVSSNSSAASFNQADERKPNGHKHRKHRRCKRKKHRFGRRRF